MIPEKLKQGDEIRIIAPSRSLALLSQENKDLATKKLEELGFKVTFGFNVDEKDEFISSSIESRVKDIHDAFSDKNVKAILTVIGGFNCNQLLSYLDYDLIKNIFNNLHPDFTLNDVLTYLNENYYLINTNKY